MFDWNGNLFTLADLTRMSGLKRRTVQLWAEGGVLIAEPATEKQGSGTHRMFSRDEAITCLILSRFVRWNISIGKLVQIAAAIRKFFLVRYRETIEQVIRGEETARMSIDDADTITLILGLNEKELADPLRILGHYQRPGSKLNETMIGVLLDKALSALRAEPRA